MCIRDSLRPVPSDGHHDGCGQGGRGHCRGGSRAADHGILSQKRETLRRRAGGRSKSASRLHGARPAGTPGNAGIRCRGCPGDRPHPPLRRGPLEGPHDGEEIHLTVMRD